MFREWSNKFAEDGYRSMHNVDTSCNNRDSFVFTSHQSNVFPTKWTTYRSSDLGRRARFKNEEFEFAIEIWNAFCGKVNKYCQCAWTLYAIIVYTSGTKSFERKKMKFVKHLKMHLYSWCEAWRRVCGTSCVLLLQIQFITLENTFVHSFTQTFPESRNSTHSHPVHRSSVCCNHEQLRW